MKVFLNFEDCLEDDLRMSIKLTLPKKWVAGPAQRLVDTFVEAYNKKHGEAPLDESETHFTLKDGTQVPFDAPVESFMTSGDELYLKNGAGLSMAALDYKPLFSKAADADASKAKAAAKPAVTSMAAARAAADAKLASSSGSSASSGAAAAAGKAKGELCKRFGCKQRFQEQDNHEEACRHHIKPPVFHETRKFWSCCPDQVGWDWDSFQAIKGCAVGRHSTEAHQTQFLGGSEVRAAEQERLAASTPQRVVTPLDKLSTLRKALVDVGVAGAAFDQARDAFRAKHEHAGDKTWELVMADLSAFLASALEAEVK